MAQGNALLAAVGGALLAAACNQSPSRGTQAGPSATPDAVVTQFLEAIRIGDDEKAAQMLTPLARTKTSEMEMVVAPPGSETAKFQVLGLEMVDGRAHVTADWTDLDTDGREHTDRIVWILRQQGEDWRISGMSTRVFADEPSLVLDFENPADMLRKQQQAEEEIARRDHNPTPQAKIPRDEPAGAVR